VRVAAAENSRQVPDTSLVGTASEVQKPKRAGPCEKREAGHDGEGWAVKGKLA